MKFNIDFSISLFFSIKQYSFDIEFNLTNWQLLYKMPEDKSVIILHIGPLQFYAWDDKKLLNYFDKLIIQYDPEDKTL